MKLEPANATNKVECAVFELNLSFLGALGAVSFLHAKLSKKIGDFNYLVRFL